MFSNIPTGLVRDEWFSGKVGKKTIAVIDSQVQDTADLGGD
jgi:hypothetical protein